MLDDPSQPYRVYTPDFDLILPACAVPEALAGDALSRAKGWSTRDPAVWREAVDRARAVENEIDSDGTLADRLRAALAHSGGDCAIALLIDQSGSMKDKPIQHVAATARWASRLLGDAGVPCSILGFSTFGWHGGPAREHWLWRGQPKRPGRLAALLHVVYQPFGQPMFGEDWTVMLHPDLLRENIDGEAIEWAASLLAERPEPRRLLIVLSDGAPVDDATLLYNGPGYLWRHLRRVIADAEAAPGLTLAAIGLNYRVDELYSRSRSAVDPATLPAALTDLIAEIVQTPVSSR